MEPKSNGVANSANCTTLLEETIGGMVFKVIAFGQQMRAQYDLEFQWLCNSK